MSEVQILRWPIDDMRVRYPSPLSGMSVSGSNENIKMMVNRFLSWRLPDDFQPDGGITFKPHYNEGTALAATHQPTGTNLLSACQAEMMVRHMLEYLPADAA